MSGTFKKMKTYVTGEEEDKSLVDEVKHEVSFFSMSVSLGDRIKWLNHIVFLCAARTYE